MSKTWLAVLLAAVLLWTPATLADDDDDDDDEGPAPVGTLFDCCDADEDQCDPRLGVECRGCGDDKGFCLCRDDRTLCSDQRGGVCVDVRQDPSHCGACDTACADGLVCVDGACSTPCQPVDVASVLRLSCEELLPGDGPCTEFFVDTGAGLFNCTEDPVLPGSCTEGDACALAPDKPGCQVIYEERTTGTAGGAIDCSSRCTSAAVCRNYCDNHAAARNAVVKSCTCEQNVCSSYP